MPRVYRFLSALLALVLCFCTLGAAASAEPGGFELKGKFFTLPLPADWEGKIDYEEKEIDGHYSLTVWHRASHEKEGCGILFSLLLWEDYGFVSLPSYLAAGVLSDGEREQILVAQLPSDVQAATDCFEEYFSLYDRDVFKSCFEALVPAEGLSFSPIDEDALQNAQACFEYENALLLAVAFNEMPDGEEIVPEDWDWDAGGNRFAVYDVNGDGREELLISVENTYVAGMRTVVYHLEEYRLTPELTAFPVPEFYANGTAKVFASHNHSYGTLWPFALYRYDPETRVYEELCSVYAWDREFSEKGFSGESFPAAVDADGNGSVFCLTRGEESAWVDDAAVEALEAEWLEDLEPLEFPWQPLTTEDVYAFFD